MTLSSEAREKKKKKTLDAAEKQMNQLKECVACAAGSPEGIITFRQIMNMCGYNQSALNVNPQTGQVNEISTIHNVGRENLWKELRQLIPINTRKKIEYGKTNFIVEGEGD